MESSLSNHISSFNYHLPRELIAQHPQQKRDASRLLVYSRNEKRITHEHFYSIGNFLRSGDTLVLNNTKVFKNRIFGVREGTGGRVEVFLLEPPMSSQVRAITKSGGKLKEGERISLDGSQIKCRIARIYENGERLLDFSVSADVLSSLLEARADVPLPPYISRPEGTTELDESRYQTVYASREGAVAAPTAGFHFTDELLESLKVMGVNTVFVTLHVGRGTFEPVRADDITQHVMHSETFEISDDTAGLINEARRAGGRIIPVGTTSMRVLESVADSLGIMMGASGSTEIFIYPPCRFKICDAMITNFHLPKSTLLMLVAAFIGREEILAVYEEAVAQKYRFFSYGDAMFLC